MEHLSSAILESAACRAPHLSKDELLQPLPSPLVLLQLEGLLPLGLIHQ